MASLCLVRLRSLRRLAPVAHLVATRASASGGGGDRLGTASAADCDGVVSDMANPYEPEPRRCLFCRHGVTPDYKNPRLLSQYTSSFTGRTYERHVTGLCREQHRRLMRAVYMSRRAGYMPVMAKNARYLNDPKLFDPMRPQRPNPY